MPTDCRGGNRDSGSDILAWSAPHDVDLNDWLRPEVEWVFKPAGPGIHLVTTRTHVGELVSQSTEQAQLVQISHRFGVWQGWTEREQKGSLIDHT